METLALVMVVDDDESMRESLPDLLGELGSAARAFGSAEDFLTSGQVVEANCLILDIGLPGMSGPDLQRELIRRGHAIPTIFMTGLGGKSIPPSLLEQGGIDCLFKPFSEEKLRAALAVALTKAGGY